ncbi:hypothetical protein PBRA_006857, partial [Plasmodiophora brassicae]
MGGDGGTGSSAAAPVPYIVGSVTTTSTQSQSATFAFNAAQVGGASFSSLSMTTPLFMPGMTTTTTMYALMPQVKYWPLDAYGQRTFLGRQYESGAWIGLGACTPGGACTVSVGGLASSTPYNFCFQVVQNPGWTTSNSTCVQASTLKDAFACAASIYNATSSCNLLAPGQTLATFDAVSAYQALSQFNCFFLYYDAHALACVNAALGAAACMGADSDAIAALVKKDCTLSMSWARNSSMVCTAATYMNATLYGHHSACSNANCDPDRSFASTCTSATVPAAMTAACRAALQTHLQQCLRGKLAISTGDTSHLNSLIFSYGQALNTFDQCGMYVPYVRATCGIAAPYSAFPTATCTPMCSSVLDQWVRQCLILYTVASVDATSLLAYQTKCHTDNSLVTVAAPVATAPTGASSLLTWSDASGLSPVTYQVFRQTTDAYGNIVTQSVSGMLAVRSFDLQYVVPAGTTATFYVQTFYKGGSSGLLSSSAPSTTVTYTAPNLALARLPPAQVTAADTGSITILVQGLPADLLNLVVVLTNTATQQVLTFLFTDATPYKTLSNSKMAPNTNYLVQVQCNAASAKLYTALSAPVPASTKPATPTQSAASNAVQVTTAGVQAQVTSFVANDPTGRNSQWAPGDTMTVAFSASANGQLPYLYGVDLATGLIGAAFTGLNLNQTWASASTAVLYVLGGSAATAPQINRACASALPQKPGTPLTPTCAVLTGTFGSYIPPFVAPTTKAGAAPAPGSATVTVRLYSTTVVTVSRFTWVPLIQAFSVQSRVLSTSPTAVVAATCSSINGQLKYGDQQAGASVTLPTVLASKLLSTLKAIKYTGAGRFYGADVITCTVSDGGNQLASVSISANVLFVKSSPSINLTSATTMPSGALTPVPAFTISAPDAENNTVEVTLTASEGPYTAPAGTRLSTLLFASGSADPRLTYTPAFGTEARQLVVKGVLPNVLAALRGLSFRTTEYGAVPADALSVRVVDTFSEVPDYQDVAVAAQLIKLTPNCGAVVAPLLASAKFDMVGQALAVLLTFNSTLGVRLSTVLDCAAVVNATGLPLLGAGPTCQ